ncbi:hypothetical protein N9937_00585 [bacterium]|nr:hypothetical protein [bacterium]
MANVNLYVVSEMVGGYPHHWHAGQAGKNARDNPHFRVNEAGTIGLMNGEWTAAQLISMRADTKCTVLENDAEGTSQEKARVISHEWDEETPE